MSDDQSATVAFLKGRREADGSAAECVETHISRIFLLGDQALKLKKAVKLDFLDFSTCERREAACRREIEVNAGATGTIYQGVAPIFRLPGGALSLGEAAAAPPFGAQVVDWVVVMRRFDRAMELHRLAEAGDLTPSLISALADVIVSLHASAPPQRDTTFWPESLRSVISNARVALGEAAEPWATAAATELHRCAPLLAARRRRGCVRRLHGDLHLGNICLIGGTPVPFDAIEFSDKIATIDALYDVAFTTMDLIGHGGSEAAERLRSRYLAATRDYGGLRAWPLFQSLRAGVRAMTAALAGDATAAQARLRLAARFLGERPAPMMVVISGLSGTGKTTVARRLAARIGGASGAVTLSTDESRKRALGLAPEDPAPREAYTPDRADAVYQRQRVDAGRALRAGVSVVLDGVFSDPSHRAAAERMAMTAGAAFYGFELQLSDALRLERVARRAATAAMDPAAAKGSDADTDIAASQAIRGARLWRGIDAAAADGGLSEILTRLAANEADGALKGV